MPQHIIRRGAVALAVLVTVSACGQAATGHPRLHSIAVTESPTPTVTVAPSPSASQAPTTEPTEPVAGPVVPVEPPCPEGPFQAEVEAALASIGNYGPITPDGIQSAQDCETIIAFQARMGIEPANGTPGPTTMDVATRIAGTDFSQCPYNDEAQACVDLTRQTFYITQGGMVILGPTVTRTGMPGWATPAGTFRIANKARTEWSVPFEVWLPYWQRFYFGDGLHETTTYIHDMWRGSHGCVNLLHDDAVAAYQLLGVGSIVHLYGRRPNT